MPCVPLFTFTVHRPFVCQGREETSVAKMYQQDTMIDGKYALDLRTMAEFVALAQSYKSTDIFVQNITSKKEADCKGTPARLLMFGFEPGTVITITADGTDPHVEKAAVRSLITFLAQAADKYTVPVPSLLNPEPSEPDPYGVSTRHKFAFCRLDARD